MAHILFISKSAEAPSTRYRALQYMSWIERAGWTAEHRAWAGGWSNRLAALSAARRADVVVVIRRTMGSITRRMLRRAARRLVFDFDDAIFLDERGEAGGSRGRRFAAMARQCDEVWAGNEYLAEHARPHADTVRVLPTSIDMARYAVDADSDPARCDLVWVGSSSTRKYLEQALPVLAAAAERSPGLRLKVIADFELVGGLEIVNVPWTADGEMAAIAESSIGIAPMPDDPWTRGKCGCKVLQYMAAGLPVVVSDVPTHRAIVRDGVDGYLASDTSQWVARIQQLAADPDLRRRLGESARARLDEHFTLNATWRKMKCALDNQLGAELQTTS